jgi:hypothetical protein
MMFGGYGWPVGSNLPVRVWVWGNPPTRDRIWGYPWCHIVTTGMGLGSPYPMGICPLPSGRTRWPASPARGDARGPPWAPLVLLHSCVAGTAAAPRLSGRAADNASTSSSFPTDALSLAASRMFHGLSCFCFPIHNWATLSSVTIFIRRWVRDCNERSGGVMVSMCSTIFLWDLMLLILLPHVVQQASKCKGEPGYVLVVPHQSSAWVQAKL